MFENIEELTRSRGELHIEGERYGDDILVCIDFSCGVNNATYDQDATICYFGHEIYDLMDDAGSPSSKSIRI